MAGTTIIMPGGLITFIQLQPWLGPKIPGQAMNIQKLRLIENETMKASIHAEFKRVTSGQPRF